MSVLNAFEQQIVAEAILSEQALNRYSAEARAQGRSLLEILNESGLSNSEPLYRALASYCELEFISSDLSAIPESITAEVPARYATHYGFVPVGQDDNHLIIALSNPLDSNLVDEIRMVLKRPVRAVVATPSDIEKASRALYGLGADTVEQIIQDANTDDHEVTLETDGYASDLGDDSIDASIVKFVNVLFAEAIESSATDIHIEPFEDELRVRYRIDGILHAVPVPSTVLGFQASIVSRVKVMANLNIAEKRLPQDGKIQVSLAGEKYDLRISLLPTPYGETLNIRILTRSSIFMTLGELGFMKDDLEQIHSFIERPHGIILVTGPTGSGKSTTLYSALNRLNKDDRKTITIEDPIEYQLKGITQMQVMPQIGFDFSMGLRSMLRHDPDVMMVGEIRDYETAEMSIRASLTGHLVFSTLHTNDASGTVTRLIDMGVEPFLIASTMIASIAQRLVRKVCDTCAQPVTPSAEALREFNLTQGEVLDGRFRMGQGCEDCRQTGYHGRLAICEILPFVQEIKELTVQSATSSEIKRKARSLGMRSLRDSGWLRVQSGETTLDEVLRVSADTDATYE
ncbi:MAG: GspE/PulE family protein [Candidatus Hydrogenedentota bacterium]